MSHTLAELTWGCHSQLRPGTKKIDRHSGCLTAWRKNA